MDMDTIDPIDSDLFVWSLLLWLAVSAWRLAGSFAQRSIGCRQNYPQSIFSRRSSGMDKPADALSLLMALVSAGINGVGQQLADAAQPVSSFD